MDSWSYGRSSFLANGTVLSSDSLTQNRKVIAGFDPGLSNDLENDDVLMSELADRSLAHMAAKSNGFSSVSISKIASSSSLLFPLEEKENQSSSSSSKFSTVATQEFTRIDFKLGSLLDYSNDGTSSRALAKKPRGSNTSSEKPLCQVYGCNMDLSFSKDYHKRHKVCEAHSKTSMVIVSGIEQRFCQQCSRFHFLSEFDDGKRSCRRRLAGHNERRRKPSLYFLQDKRHKLLQTSQGSSRLVGFKDEPTCSMFPAFGQNSSRIYESKPLEASGVPSIWDLHEVTSRSTCALSLLSAQSQQHFPEMPNTTFSITQHNQMEPLWINPGKSSSGSGSCTGKGSSTVDLLQLSSHLQRIEQQRNLADEVKQEHNELYFPSSLEQATTFLFDW